jgi:hypothetical protein
VLDDRPVAVGEPLWAMGHTGYGYWALSWGMSQGIASGTIEVFGAKLVLFDTRIYPGFSGGPLVTLDPQGKPRVVGVNHASFRIRSTEIYSAVATSELRAVMAGTPFALEPMLAAYAKEQRDKVWADLFITERLAVSRDAVGQPVALIMGNAKSLDADAGDTRVPCAAMLFGLKEGVHPVEFEVRDPTERLLEAPCRAGSTRLSEYARGSVMGGSSTRRRHRARSQARSRRPRRSLPRNRARRRTRWSWRRVEAATPAREQEGRSLRVLEREARSHVKPEHRETRKAHRESLSLRSHTVG